MKITTIEKTVLSIMAVIVLVIGASLYMALSAIDEAGGINQIIIDAGKDIKDISREIEKH